MRVALEIGLGLQHLGDPTVTGDLYATEWVALAMPVLVIIAAIILPAHPWQQAA